MTYQRIFDLKFKEEVPTYKLGKRYPKERKKISRVALLELPLSLLHKLITRKKEFQKLASLKQQLFKNEINRKTGLDTLD